MLAILNYHNVGPVPAGMRMPQLYVSARKFERQMWSLRRLGFQGVTLAEGMQLLSQGDVRRHVVITFDDGYQDNLQVAAPILREHGFRATCFIVSSYLGQHNAWDASQLGGCKALMNQHELAAWLGHDFEIGSHTCSHPDLTRLPKQRISAELIFSRSLLQRLTGAKVESFCYPFGRSNLDLARRVASVGYRYAVTTRRGRAGPTASPHLLPRISIDGRKSLAKFLLKATTGYCDVF